MKRNLELIRFLLIKLEECNHYNIRLSELIKNSPYTLEEADYNVRLLSEANYVKVFGFAPAKNAKDWLLIRLTFIGHEYLDAIRDDTVWRKTRDKLLTVGGTASLEMVKVVAYAIAKTILDI